MAHYITSPDASFAYPGHPDPVHMTNTHLITPSSMRTTPGRSKLTKPHMSHQSPSYISSQPCSQPSMTRDKPTSKPPTQKYEDDDGCCICCCYIPAGKRRDSPRRGDGGDGGGSGGYGGDGGDGGGGGGGGGDGGGTFVSKQWMQVATSLPYECIVLRSIFQVKALVVALEANPEFGKLIKRVRVEGGFGMDMHDIISVAPNIRCLMLSFEVWQPDTPIGLTECLGLMENLESVGFMRMQGRVGRQAPPESAVFLEYFKEVLECIAGGGTYFFNVRP
ncbi:hypothetical protein BDV98DRAFT_656903 [Pterulicium gracile]|uniref:Uncharacterized protein n=1 Tax=Pterulicium gracile TaxID=1884261 RepID=A0A5C3QG20_9AGAR|nr:hypothetical protein BDV98DRAFT_656903 [Pterula gracilis]